jgi:hypothetical protein
MFVSMCQAECIIEYKPLSTAIGSLGHLLWFVDTYMK